VALRANLKRISQTFFKASSLLIAATKSSTAILYHRFTRYVRSARVTMRARTLTEQILVAIYGDLLDFYFAASKILNSKRFGIDLAISAVKASLDEPISSLERNTSSLIRLVQLETFATAKAIHDGQLNEMGE
jgi:hypothetical protein